MRGIVVALVVLGLTGCGLKTQVMRLDTPVQDRVIGTLKPVVIDSVVDARDFWTIPEGSEPRLDPKVANQLGPQRLGRAISGFPHGGFVTLLDNRTVPDAVKDVVIASLHDRGYDVVSAEQAPADAPHLAIRVTEFWSYMPFSFGRSLTWTNQLKAWVATDISVKTPTLERQFAVGGHGAHIIQAYKIENIQQAYDLALAEYRTNLDAKLFGSL